VPTKPPPRSAASAAIRRSVGTISRAAITRMDQEMEWFRALTAQERSWIGMVVQAGIRAFADWYDEHGTERTLKEDAEHALAADIFGAAPRAFAGVISLEQTVDLSRLTIDVVEDHLPRLLPKEQVAEVHNAILRFGREYAFATAQVYARAAEVRGAWDARLEALVVDGVLREQADEAVLSQAGALGWSERGRVVVVFGRAPIDKTLAQLFDDVRRVARAAKMDALCGSRGDRVVIVLGGVDDPLSATEKIVDHLGPGPVVFGPLTPDLGHAHVSAQAAAAGYAATVAWPHAPRPVSSDDLLPERALGGDEGARQQLVDEVYRPLHEAKGTLIETLDAYFGHGGSIEATARSLFVHPNTVRYRLRQTAELTGMTPNDARHAYAIRLAITLGRLSHA
jgi:hypothetical protein